MGLGIGRLDQGVEHETVIGVFVKQQIAGLEFTVAGIGPVRGACPEGLIGQQGV